MKEGVYVLELLGDGDRGVPGEEVKSTFMGWRRGSSSIEPCKGCAAMRTVSAPPLPYSSFQLPPVSAWLGGQGKLGR